ncbi:phospho-N-acetylmuramoyl-pentapeptide-transferase [Sphaerochaeta sp. S2]|uniref:phospho-N-acetylmuramoyl-pentapeptide- transferase n=1 Tax=Sphaerochaeta sp. S2 TaxID=2798868 RepID=UPI0018E98518|nr:phospho-N-acetylmuramoyl-pentapeptide-transferase [Sphaerochaeta sp. S2]MBJ2357786.1 phospho-N-acetylmuramoyl-pentapeptide-transferase [Sphaerochaeta sp. S2]MCK9347761.1 phospho-N-acetylmuramoyl-pentapeptide-transferase [Sphaerochaeta sp.]MDD4301021.1 phospho-N-acetylmuramoyl-pentapeptide-transferase [Sphaerochaeta sp.]
MPDRLLLLFVLSFVVTFVISKVLLSFVKQSDIAVKPELRAFQKQKAGTPVLGGLAFTLGTLLVSLFDPSLSNPQVLFPLLALVIFAGIGFLDDHMKSKHSNGDGLPSVVKLLLQMQGALLLLILAKGQNLLITHIDLVVFQLDLGIGYYLFALLYILYFVNAVNITDGLDALAAGSSLPMLLLLVMLSLKTGSMASSALLGSLLAFLFFNLPPARYFMGDCGSHALGAYIAMSALLMGSELVLFLASGLFLLELASSLIQIISIRRFGRKVFTIAPLHHAYELKGVKEGRIVVAFTLVSWLFAAVSLLISR